MGLPAEAEQTGRRCCGCSGILSHLPARGSALTVHRAKLQTGANTIFAPRGSQPHWLEPVHFEDEDGRKVFRCPFPELVAQRVGPNPFSSSPPLPPSLPWPTSQALALSTLQAASLPEEHLTTNAFSQGPPKPPSHPTYDRPVEAEPRGKLRRGLGKPHQVAPKTVTVHTNRPPGKVLSSHPNVGPLFGHWTCTLSDWGQCR